MTPGSSANPMSLISAFGAALRMSSFRKTSTTLFNPTWRLVFLLAIHLGTRAGSSTIPLQGSTSSLNRLNSMNAPFLDLASTLQSPVDLTAPKSLAPPPDTTPDLLLDLGGNGDVNDRTTATLSPVPVPALPLPPPLDVPVDLPPLQLPILPPVPPSIPDAPHRTQRVSCPPGEWWKVRHPAEPPAEPPIIWSDDEENAPEEQLINLVSDPEPCTFRQAMHGDQSDCWREAATLEYNTLVDNGTWEVVDLPLGEKAIGSG